MEIMGKMLTNKNETLLKGLNYNELNQKWIALMFWILLWIGLWFKFGFACELCTVHCAHKFYYIFFLEKLSFNSHDLFVGSSRDDQNEWSECYISGAREWFRWWLKLNELNVSGIESLISVALLSDFLSEILSKGQKLNATKWISTLRFWYVKLFHFFIQYSI